MHHEQFKADEDVDIGNGDEEPVAVCINMNGDSIERFSCTLYIALSHINMAFTFHLCVYVWSLIWAVDLPRSTLGTRHSPFARFCLTRSWTKLWYMSPFSCPSRRREWAPKRPCKGARYKGCIHACGCLSLWPHHDGWQLVCTTLRLVVALGLSHRRSDVVVQLRWIGLRRNQTSTHLFGYIVHGHAVWNIGMADLFAWRLGTEHWTVAAQDIEPRV